MRWVEQDLNIMDMLPFLSTYMVHSEISSTLYYVHLLPEKLRQSAKIEWDQFSSIFEKGGEAE